MSVTSKLRSVVFGEPIAPPIAKQLEEAHAKLAEQEARYGDAALQAAIDGDEKLLATLEAETEEQRRIVSRLGTALRVALAKDEQANAQRRAEINKGQILALQKHLAAQARFGAEVEQAVARASAAFNEMRKTGQKIATLYTNLRGGDVPAWTMATPGALLAAIKTEIARNSMTFPGAQIDGGWLLAHGISGRFEGQPEALPSLSKLLAQAHETLIADVTGSPRPSSPTIPVVDADGAVHGVMPVDEDLFTAAPEAPAAAPVVIDARSIPIRKTRMS